MRHLSTRLLTSLLTFAVGISCVAVVNKLQFSVQSAYRLVSRNLRLSKPHFEQKSVACGRRFHVYNYRSDNGQAVEESGTYFADRAEGDAYFQKVIARAERIIERDYGFLNAYGKTGERIVFARPAGPDGSSSGVTIIWYGRENIQTIDAPTEALAREFEQYLFDTVADENYKYYRSYLPFPSHSSEDH